MLFEGLLKNSAWSYFSPFKTQYYSPTCLFDILRYVVNKKIYYMLWSITSCTIRLGGAFRGVRLSTVLNMSENNYMAQLHLKT